MLSENTINGLADVIANRISKVNTEFLEELGKKIKEIGKLSSSDTNKLNQLKSFGSDINKVEAKLAEVSGKNILDIHKIFKKTAKDNYEFSKQFYDWKGIEWIPYFENIILKRYVNSIARKTAETYINLSNSKCIALIDSQGLVRYYSLSSAYKKAVDKAVTAVTMGVSDYNKEMRGILKNYARSGLRAYYDSGYSQRLDIAVRRNVLEGIRQINIGIQDQVGREFGADGKEISVHEAPAVDHEPIQGLQYSNEEYEALNKRLKRPIGTLNCYHFAFSIILGVSEPNYNKDQLEAIKGRNKKGAIIDGKHYTTYECTQLQRNIEKTMRITKDEWSVFKASGDKVGMREANRKITELKNKYIEITDKAGISSHLDRASVVGYKR